MQHTDNCTRTQAVIIGAGPTGLSMAAQLQRYNINYVILEWNEGITKLSKAVVVQARTLEIFEELGLAEEAVRRGRLTTALNIYYKGQRKAEIDLAGLGDGISAFPFVLSLEQSKTEQLLADHLAKYQSFVSWQSEVTAIEQQKDSIMVTYTNSAGEQQSIEAEYVVGCDGAGSIVRHQLGLHFEGDTVPRLFYVADVVLKSSVINKDQLFLFLIRKGIILFFPMEGNGHYRIIGVLPDASTDGESYEFEDIRGWIEEQVAVPLTIEEPRWFSTYKVHSRKASTFAVGRCFLAGDAAHIHTPAGGQGMNTGIQDAYNLAWKIALRLKGEVNEKVLSTYDTERSANAEHLLKTTDTMFDFMAGTTVVANIVRLYLVPMFAGVITRSRSIKKRIFPLVSQTSISYDESYLTIPGKVGNVSAGVRMPHFVLGDGSHILQHLTEPCFKLLIFGPGEAAKGEDLSSLGTKVQVLRFTYIPAHLFGAATAFYVLLRPDNHISYIGNDREAYRRLLNEWRS